MNMRFGLKLTAVALLAATTLTATAQDAAEGAVKARQAHMQLYAFNLGALGAMAKGAVEYDAEAATRAATNLATLAALDTRDFWLPGSAAGEVEGSRALPAMWSADSNAMVHAGNLRDATAALAASAGTDLASLQAGMGPVGGACSACHKAYRQAD
ncbi:cytochrome c [Celeribacter arenosi]|uniref:Cytochrome c n=1 Tax=Celeribacter arenosi TaxID=792649 RepID=A0ABP7KH58_9RHOB